MVMYHDFGWVRCLCAGHGVSGQTRPRNIPSGQGETPKLAHPPCVFGMGPGTGLANGCVAESLKHMRGCGSWASTAPAGAKQGRANGLGGRRWISYNFPYQLLLAVVCCASVPRLLCALCQIEFQNH